MRAKPISLKQANEYVSSLHRHHVNVHRDKFRIGVCDDNNVLRGVVQVGRPVSRHLDDGKTLEVVRLCTDGYKNACSFLYQKASRIAKEMGYERIITYILDEEIGCSLKAAGWVKEADTKGGSWNSPSRPRVDKAPICKKQRWSRKLIKEGKCRN